MEGTAENIQAYSNLKGKIIAIPKVDTTFTKAGHAADAKATGEELEKRVLYTDIVDNLTSDAPNKPVSARQATAIKKRLDDIDLSQAATVGYNNSTSGLEATNMQSAIDEIAKNVSDTEQAVSDMSDVVDKFDEDYLSKKGGMVDGAVSVRNADNGYGQVMKNNSANADYGTQLSDTAKDGRTAKISISALLGLLTYTDADGNIRDIHHEGTKPFGNYKGNGSAVTRTIDTKGIGRLILVYNPSYFSFVTPQGALVVTLSEGTIKWIDGSKIYFLNGTLGISTANEAFNASNTDYYYQVI